MKTADAAEITSLGGNPRPLAAAKKISGDGFKFLNKSADTIASKLPPNQLPSEESGKPQNIANHEKKETYKWVERDTTTPETAMHNNVQGNHSSSHPLQIHTRKQHQLLRPPCH
jgi:hypothetical protein